MKSPNNTVISLSGQAIIDAAGNVWSIVAGQVIVNGVIDSTTANVIEMAYENGMVWQKNSNNLWWSKTSPIGQWSPPYGTTVDPIPNQHASANDATLLGKPTGTIVDARGDLWTIANGQVLINGTADPTTARVVELVYSGGQVWQKNADNLWWAKSSPTSQWLPPYGTTTAPTPDRTVTVNTVVLSSSDAPIMDASGNQWAIVNGQVTLNGLVDQTTRNVTELAYVNGQIWQENANGLWWSKTRPSDQWGPANGTPVDPVQNVSRVWFGQNGDFATAADWSPSGVPLAGDTAIINTGTVSVDPDWATGVNFDLRGAGANVIFIASVVGPNDHTIGKIDGTGTVVAPYAFSAPASGGTVTSSGVGLAPGDRLTLESWYGPSFVLRGNSDLESGSTLSVTETGGHAQYTTLENDGALSLNGATLIAGYLTGTGVIDITNGGSLGVTDGTPTSETIELQSGHFEMGAGAGAFGPPLLPALDFLAPITDFGTNSSIKLDLFEATAEVFKQISASAHELMLYNGSTLVADLHISGQNMLYADYTSPTSGGPSVTISAHNDGHALPIVSHVP